VALLWVPAHTGVEGNGMADEHAKRATGKNNIDIDVKYSKAEIKSIVNHSKVAYLDNGGRGRHLYRIQGIVGKDTHTHTHTQPELDRKTLCRLE